MNPGRLPRWIVIWSLVSIALVGWDVAFVLLRPASMPGGSLDVLWRPYGTYISVDHSYGDLDNGFVWAQAIMSALELLIAITALVLDARGRTWLPTLLIFAVSVLTAAKTLLILLIEAVTGLEHVGHNPAGKLIGLYLAPNVVWVVMPLVVAWVTARGLLAALPVNRPSGTPAGSTVS